MSEETSTTPSRLNRALAQVTPERIAIAVALTTGTCGFVMGFHALAHIRVLNEVTKSLIIETGGNVSW